MGATGEVSVDVLGRLSGPPRFLRNAWTQSRRKGKSGVEGTVVTAEDLLRRRAGLCKRTACRHEFTGETDLTRTVRFGKSGES